jgi:hypothetical protein
MEYGMFDSFFFFSLICSCPSELFCSFSPRDLNDDVRFFWSCAGRCEGGVVRAAMGVRQNKGSSIQVSDGGVLSSGCVAIYIAQVQGMDGNMSPLALL